MPATTIKDLTPLIKSFEWMGFDLCARKNEMFFKYPKRLLIPAAGIFIWCYAIFSYIFHNLGDVDKAVQSIMPALQVVLTLVKCILIIHKQRNIRELIQRVDQLAVESNSVEKEFAVWNSAMSTIKTIGSIYRMVAHITLIVCFMAPLITIIVSYARTGEVLFMLPIPALFPFDHTRPFYYMLANITFLQFALVSVQVIVGVDTLFGWFIFSISGHLQVLLLKLQEAVDDQNSPQQFRCKFNEMIRYHQHINAVKFEFDEVFALIIFTEILFSCLLMCFIMYEFAFSRDLANLLFVFTFMLLCVTQLMMYCLGGEKIKNESESICQSIYLLTPWQDLSPRVQHLFQLALLRSQHELSVSGYFFIADHTLLLWVFKSAGSVAALLFAVKEGN